MFVISCVGPLVLLQGLLRDPLTVFDLAESYSANFYRDFWKRGGYKLRGIAAGGYGSVSEVERRDGSALSLPSGSRVVVKTNKLQNIPWRSLVKSRDSTFLFDHRVSEALFACAVRYIYDLKVCPYLPYYVSVNVCKPDIVIFVEKYTMEFSQLVSDMDPRELLAYVYQFVYAVYVYKSYAGLVHFDTHLRNVMLHDDGGRAKYTVFVDSKKSIVIPKTRYSVKIIDFGLCWMDLESAVDASYLRRNMAVGVCDGNSTSAAVPPMFESTLVSASKRCTVDIQYFLLHLYQLCSRRKLDHLTAVIDEFCARFYSDKSMTMAEQLRRNPTWVLPVDRGVLSVHDVGVDSPLFTGTKSIMENLVRTCTYGGDKYASPFQVRVTDWSEVEQVRARNVLTSVVDMTVLDSTVPVEWWREGFYILAGLPASVTVVRSEESKFELRHGDSGYHSDDPFVKSDVTVVWLSATRVPFSSSNAYFTVRPEGTVRVHRLRRSQDLTESTVCVGKFVVFDGSPVKCDPGQSVSTLLTWRSGTMWITNLAFPVPLSAVAEWLAARSFSHAVNATGFCSLHKRERVSISITRVSAGS